MSLDNPLYMDLLCFDGFTKPFLLMFFKVIGFLLVVGRAPTSVCYFIQPFIYSILHPNILSVAKIKWDKVFKNGPGKICGRHSALETIEKAFSCSFV